MSAIDLKRGSTLTLLHAAGAVVRIDDGQAWFSAREGSHRMRPGDSAALGAAGTTLIHALEDATLQLEGLNGCRIEMRRRGEVAPCASAAQDEERIDIADVAALERWAERLCCSPQELRRAVEAVGPRLGDVKRYLFEALLRRCFKSRNSYRRGVILFTAASSRGR